MKSAWKRLSFSPCRFNHSQSITRIKPHGFWEDRQNILQFLEEIKQKYNLNTPEDWNLITQKHIQENGGSRLLSKYSMYELKSMACPEGKSFFNKQRKPEGYWEDKQNILQFLEEIKEKYNLNTPEDWNSITQKLILDNGGNRLLNNYSMFELKCMACPEGRLLFNKSNRYWDDKENILNFLEEIKQKYNLNTPEDWNLITQKHIHSNGGNRLLRRFTLFELKCLACPEGKSIFDKPKYWEDRKNILQFLSEIKEKYNLTTPEDWNSISYEQIQSNGGRSLLRNYSLYELKIMACPEGKQIFTKPKESGYWENKENILQFLEEIKQKYNLNTPEDWNLITQKQIQENGGGRLLHNYSMYELKCMACPEGKSIFDKQPKSSKFWEDKENILQFLEKLKQKYNLNTPENWNSITQKYIQENGGRSLLRKYSMFDLKCMACPEGKSFYNKKPKPAGYWENERNRNHFFESLAHKYNLKTPQDWKRISLHQIVSHGGHWLFYSNNEYLEKTKITFDIPNTENNTNTEKTTYHLKELISEINYKRSAQRWLFLQVQKIFPHEEIVEDYFHSEISRDTGFSVQFDIFLIRKNIAIEYHGIQHYEDVSKRFASLEMYKNRDFEKQTLCKKYGIQLIIIPYWWDNRADSLLETLSSVISR